MAEPKKYQIVDGRVYEMKPGDALGIYVCPAKIYGRHNHKMSEMVKQTNEAAALKDLCKALWNWNGGYSTCACGDTSGTSNCKCNELHKKMKELGVL